MAQLNNFWAGREIKYATQKQAGSVPDLFHERDSLAGMSHPWEQNEEKILK